MIEGEEPITLRDAAAEAARLMGPLGCSPGTVRLWITRGLGGTRLEARRTGWRWLTSKEAVARFLAKVEQAALAGGA